MKVTLLSRVRLFVNPWTVAYQAPLSMRFSRQGYWSGLPFQVTHFPILKAVLQGTTLELFPSVAWLLGSNNCVALNSSKPNYDLISPTSQLLVLLYIETESDKFLWLKKNV